MSGDADDFEIRRFRMRGCSDEWGERVYAAAAAPSEIRERDAADIAAAAAGRVPWTVYHRPERGTMFPVKLLHVASFEAALELCRTLVKTYNLLDSIDSSITSARREGAPDGGSDGSEREAPGSNVEEGRTREA